ncbi:MAG: DUF4129 domain-containing protein [Deltaproteobacteria bacterium]|nr:DUF4129 domain-containing protein [Deltaproteobacteria bacterium]
MDRAAPIDPDAVRRVAQEVIAQSHYKIGSAEPREPAWMRDLEAFLKGLFAPLDRVFGDVFGGNPVIGWVVFIALFVLLIVLVVHLIYSFRQAFDDGAGTGIADRSGGRTDPATLERMAADASGRGDYVGAVRLLFRAAITHLARMGRSPHRPGMTNWAYVRWYRRSSASGALKELAAVIDRSWYGHAPCAAEDYERGLAAYRSIVASLPSGGVDDRSA